MKDKELIDFYQNSTDEYFSETIENSRNGNTSNRNDIPTLIFTDFYKKYFKISEFWKNNVEVETSLVKEIDNYIDMFREYSKLRNKSFGKDGVFHMMMKSDEFDSNKVYEILDFRFTINEYIFITCADKKYLELFLEQFFNSIVNGKYKDYAIYVACPENDYEECKKMIEIYNINLVLCPIKVDSKISCYEKHSHYSSLRIFLLNEYIKKFSEYNEISKTKIIMCDIDCRMNKDSADLASDIFQNDFEFCFKTWKISKPWQICAMGIVLIKINNSISKTTNKWTEYLSFWFRNLGYFNWGDQLTFENSMRQLRPKILIGDEVNKKLTNLVTFYNGSIENKIKQI